MKASMLAAGDTELGDAAAREMLAEAQRAIDRPHQRPRAASGQ